MCEKYICSKRDIRGVVPDPHLHQLVNIMLAFGKHTASVDNYPIRNIFELRNYLVDNGYGTRSEIDQLALEDLLHKANVV